MSEEGLRYDYWVEESLRQVVRLALQHVVKEGLPGDHHFYITFLTDHPGVEIASRLKERYSQEMTIVLQHRFWDLEVEEEHFSVMLTFNEIAEKLIIPFSAVVAFADPSVPFGLQFGGGDMDDLDLDDQDDEDYDGEGPSARQDLHGRDDSAKSFDEGEDGDEKVVTLDQFRKKP